MSIGDSLLDFITKNEIKTSKRNYFADIRKYYVVAISKNLKNYAYFVSLTHTFP